MARCATKLNMAWWQLEELAALGTRGGHDVEDADDDQDGEGGGGSAAAASLLKKNERLMTPEERKAARKLRKQQAKEQKQVRRDTSKLDVSLVRSIPRGWWCHHLSPALR
jgi:hypothetical protein